MKNLNIDPENNFNTARTSIHSDAEILELMNKLRMSAMRAAYQEQKDSSKFNRLSLVDQLFELLSAEQLKRENSGYVNRLKKSDRETQTSAAQFIERASNYSLTHQQADYLLSGKWFGEQTLVITGASGTGKTSCCSAIIEATCRGGKRALNLRYPMLVLEICDIMTRPTDFKNYIKHLCHYDLIVIDDFCITRQLRINEPEAIKELLDRCLQSSCGLIISSQVNSSGWHKHFGGDAIAEAIVERIITKDKYFALTLTGDSMRAGKAADIPDDKQGGMGAKNE